MRSSCLAAHPKSDLPPGFVDDHRYGIGKIEASALRDQGYADTPLLINTPPDLRRQPTAFRAKHKNIAVRIGDQVVPLSAFGRYREQTAILHACRTFGPTFVNRDCGKFVIVETCSQQLLILQRKAQRFDEMQPGSAIGAESYNVTGVRRNLRLIEDDVKHGRAVEHGDVAFHDAGETKRILFSMEADG